MGAYHDKLFTGFKDASKARPSSKYQPTNKQPTKASIVDSPRHSSLDNISMTESALGHVVEADLDLGDPDLGVDIATEAADAVAPMATWKRVVLKGRVTVAPVLDPPRLVPNAAPLSDKAGLAAAKADLMTKWAELDSDKAERVEADGGGEAEPESRYSFEKSRLARTRTVAVCQGRRKPAPSLWAWHSNGRKLSSDDNVVKVTIKWI